jgi:inosine/xanthosine triphosphatase
VTSLQVAIGTKNKAKTAAVEQVVNQYFKQVTYRHTEVESAVSEQPFSSEETRIGAINRAKNASVATNADFSFGLEGGVEEIEGIMYCVNWGAVALKNGTIYTAAGASFMLPEEIAVQLREGKELGPIMDFYTSKENIRHHEGAVGIFTNGLIDRKAMFEHIVTLLVGQVYYYEQLEKLTEN